MRITSHSFHCEHVMILLHTWYFTYIVYYRHAKHLKPADGTEEGYVMPYNPGWVYYFLLINVEITQCKNGLCVTVYKMTFLIVWALGLRQPQRAERAKVWEFGKIMEMLSAFAQLLLTMGTTKPTFEFSTCHHLHTHDVEWTTLIHKISAPIVESAHELIYDYIKVFQCVGTTLLRTGILIRLEHFLLKYTDVSWLCSVLFLSYASKEMPLLSCSP